MPRTGSRIWNRPRDVQIPRGVNAETEVERNDRSVQNERNAPNDRTAQGEAREPNDPNRPPDRSVRDLIGPVSWSDPTDRRREMIAAAVAGVRASPWRLVAARRMSPRSCRRSEMTATRRSVKALA